MKNYTGHHTCEKTGGFEKVLNDAPFFSEYLPGKENEKKSPYLGSGYYFWEYDLKQAKKWGEQHYNNIYFVVEGIIHTTDENFLDLVGDRKHIEYFLSLCKMLMPKNIQINEWEIGRIIEFFKRINKINATIFPFSVLRAQDYNYIKNKQLQFDFRGGISWTYLDPRHIFCIINLNNLILSGKKIVYSNPQ